MIPVPEKSVEISKLLWTKAKGYDPIIALKPWEDTALLCDIALRVNWTDVTVILKIYCRLHKNQFKFSNLIKNRKSFKMAGKFELLQ